MTGGFSPALPPSVGGAVDSVFSRTGAVIAITGDYTASQVTNVPNGNIAAVTVQDAVNELDTEKVAKTGDVMTGSLQAYGTGQTQANAALRAYSDDPGFSGAMVALVHDRASPAAFDGGRLAAWVRNSSAGWWRPAQIGLLSESITAGAENGVMTLNTTRAGSLDTRFNIGAGLYAQSLTDPGAGNAAFGTVFLGSGLDTSLLRGGVGIIQTGSGNRIYVNNGTDKVLGDLGQFTIQGSGYAFSIHVGSAATVLSTNSGSRKLQLGVSGVAYWEVDNGTAAFRPVTDNFTTVGGASNRPSILFAVSGTIATSDEVEKEQFAPIPDNLKRAVAEICRTVITSYKWKSSVKEKGDEARTHYGVIAQRVRDVVLKWGIDADKCAFLCTDALEDGSIRWGVRHDQLWSIAMNTLFDPPPELPPGGEPQPIGAWIESKKLKIERNARERYAKAHRQGPKPKKFLGLFG